VARGALTPGLEADTALEPLGDGRWRGEISERWWIRAPTGEAGWSGGLYGGYVSAFMTRALTAAVADPARAPRSLTVHFLAAPAAGPVEVEAVMERAGRSVSFVSLRMEQEGRPVALALGSAAVWREGTAEWQELAPPDVAAPEDCPVIGGPPLPPFTENFEIRWADGERGRARNVTWVRPQPEMPLDHVAVTALSDTMVPAAFSRLGHPAIVPTLDLTIHFRAPLPPAGDDGWALAVYSSGRSAGGAWEEDGELWSRDGVLLAQSRQLAVMR
jgi:acyl-CoA thioesterase